MIDLDQVLWLPYVGMPGTPILVAELKPEGAKEDFWSVTRALAQKANLPAAKLIDRHDGLYDVYTAEKKHNWEQRLRAQGWTIYDWYHEIEGPLREEFMDEAA